MFLIMLRVALLQKDCNEEILACKVLYQGLFMTLLTPAKIHLIKGVYNCQMIPVNYKGSTREFKAARLDILESVVKD